MSAPLVPSPLDYVGRRKFLLFPPISNIAPNEWLRGKTSWSEAQLVNAVTGQDIWVPWQSICGVSDGPDLQLVVELKDELEYRDGNVSLKVKRVITMPALPENAPELPRRRRGKRNGPAPVIGIKIEDEASTGSHVVSKIVLVLVALFLLATLVFRIVRL